eukprot:6752329-Prymnesium_polylepis.1
MVPTVHLVDSQPLEALRLAQCLPCGGGVLHLDRVLHSLHEQALDLERTVAIVGCRRAARQLGNVHVAAVGDAVHDAREDLLERRAQLAKLAGAARYGLLQDVRDLLLRCLAGCDEGAAQHDWQQLTVGAVDGDDGGEERRLPTARAVGEELPPIDRLGEAECGESLGDDSQLAAHLAAEIYGGHMHLEEGHE